MFKKILKYIEKISVKDILVEKQHDKIILKLDSLSLNSKGTPDLAIRKLVISGAPAAKIKNEKENMPLRFEGIDILISQNFITSLLNVSLAKVNFIDYLKFKIKNSKLILKGAFKKYISFPFYIEININHLKNFLCVEFKSMWFMDILPFPTFTLSKFFKFLDAKINLPFVAFEGSKIFVDFERIEFFNKNKLMIKKIGLTDGFINFVMDIEI